VNGRIRNFSTISALNILTSNISTGTTSVDQIYTRNININPQSTVYISHPDLTINANITTDEGEDPQYNNLNLYASSNINIQSFTTSGGGGNINIQCGNNPAAFSVNITGDTYVSRTLTANLGMSTTNINLSTINGAAYVPGGGGVSVSSFTNLFATNASTTNLFVSSINGAAYPPSGGGGSWVSTATTDLNMNNFNIRRIRTTISFQGGGLIKDYDVGIHLFDIDGNGAAQTRLKNGSADVVLLPAGDIYFAGVLHSQNDLDMMSHNITAVSSITSAGELSISATTNIKTSAVSTIIVSSINVNVEAAEVVGLAAGNSLANYTTIGLFSTSVFIAQVGDTTGVIDINAAGNITTTAFSTINTVQNTYFSGGVSRRLDGVGVPQPVIQYGEFSSSGSSGNTTVTLPAAYTAVNTYVAFACMEDSTPAEISVVRTDTSNIEVYWANSGGGSHTIVWQTLGT
jgi:hypothetical protein